MSKLLTVFGATGAQGGSLINFVLQHPKLSKDNRLRGITRDVSKPAATDLQARGVEVVKADMSDPSSLEKAVAGSYAVFAMTNFWDHQSGDLETQQGISVADACVSQGVSLLIWSSLPNITKMTNGKITGMHHFDSKAKVEDYIRVHVMSKGVKAVFFVPCMYMQLFQTMFKPQPDENGVFTLSNSWGKDTGVPLIDITETGKYLAPILLSSSPGTYDGASFLAASGYYTPAQICDVWTTVTGKEVKYLELQPGEEKFQGFPEEVKRVMKDAAGLMRGWGMVGPTGPKDLEWTLQQVEAGGEELTNWEDFVKREPPW